LAQKARTIGVTIKENTPIKKNQLTEMLNEYSYIIDASGAPPVTSWTHGFISDYLRNATILAQYLVEGDFRFLGKNTLKASMVPIALVITTSFQKEKIV
jgi:digeranylgeranylglycerophospholipid reductase